MFLAPHVLEDVQEIARELANMDVLAVVVVAKEHVNTDVILHVAEVVVNLVPLIVLSTVVDNGF